MIMKEFKKIDKRSASYKAMSKEDKELYNQLLKDSNKSKGLGDDIEKIMEVTGIKTLVKSVFGDKDCGCDERKAILNKKFKYKDVQCLEEDEFNYLKDFFGRLGTRIQPRDQEAVLKIYNRVFKQNNKPTQCSSCWVAIISNIRQMYEYYLNETTQ